MNYICVSFSVAQVGNRNNVAGGLTILGVLVTVLFKQERFTVNKSNDAKNG